MTRSVGIQGRQYSDRNGSMITELSDGCSRWVIGSYVITHRRRNVNWIQLGLARISWCLWPVGLSGSSYDRIHPLSLYIVRTFPRPTMRRLAKDVERLRRLARRRLEWAYDQVRWHSGQAVQ